MYQFYFLSVYIISHIPNITYHISHKIDHTQYHHHHHVMRLARISLTLSLHVSLSFIASGRSSGLHPVSLHSCCIYVRAGRPASDWLYAEVLRSTSFTISSLLLQQCPVCLVRLACIVFVIGGRWPYSWCLVGCCCQDLFYTRMLRAILNTQYITYQTSQITYHISHTIIKHTII